jgi:hypothetical protein
LAPPSSNTESLGVSSVTVVGKRVRFAAPLSYVLPVFRTPASGPSQETVQVCGVIASRSMGSSALTGIEGMPGFGIGLGGSCGKKAAVCT